MLAESHLPVAVTVLDRTNVVEAGFDMAALLRRARRRDEDAARLLLHHLNPLVLKLVRAHRPRRTSEEDLVQTVFMKVFTHLDQYSGKVPLEHWVARIAVNTCLNQLQSERIRPELRWADLSEEEVSVLDSLAATSEDLQPSQDFAARDLVDKLLDCLKPEDRLVIKMLNLEGRSVQEIRQRTGWNASLIKVRAFRARARLRKQFAKLMKEKSP
jgi:RNA polymerase sigma-70 factor (ECF subfamily)